jgi:predicted porin
MTPIRSELHGRTRAGTECPTEESASVARFSGLLMRLAAGLLGTCCAVAAVAQTPSGPAAPSDSLTWNGLTLYGIVDVGLQYQTHGVPVSDYFPAGTEAIVQKNSNSSVTGVTPSNLSQSRIGLSGNEPLVGDWAGVFRVETFFNPQSGDISDALKSLTLNNGRAASVQTTNVDSSVAGQLFAGAAYAGFSSPTVGTFTFGRHVTPLADGVAKYDPLSASNAFSLIGFSGTTAGGGDTEDRRLDQSVKYTGKYGPLHLGALYQFSGSSGSTNTAFQATIGGDFAGGSVDAYYAKKYDAVAAAPLAQADINKLNAACAGVSLVVPAPAVTPCFSLSNSVKATISDNTTYGVMGLYNLGTVKLSAGYEHIQFADPSNPLEAGSLTIGGYVLAVTSNTAFEANDKTLQVFWAGFKWSMTPNFDLLAAYYGYKQNSYGKKSCSDTSAGTCSGTENSFSIVGDYRLSKRFDMYLGTFYTGVQDGLANGFDFNTSTVTTTAGIRFKF